MRRREFVAGLGATAASPIVARAQQPSLPVVGVLSGTSPLSSPGTPAFHRGLSEIGYVEGRNVAIEYRSAEGRIDTLPDLAADLVRRRVSVIFAAGGESAAKAAKAATSTTPIVFSAVDDPVRLGLVASLNRPGGNLTGMSIFNSETNVKRLDLLRELVPQITTMGLLVWPVPDMENQTNDALNAARTLGVALHIVDVQQEGGLDAAFEALVRLKVGALIVYPTAYAMAARHLIPPLAARHAIPTIYPARDFVVAGGLIGYGVNFPDIYHQAGIYVGRILKGEAPGELPVQRPTKFDFAINLKTAKALGIEFTPKLLSLADEVIE
jgi:putative ABC transport system substrate-binding protein